MRLTLEQYKKHRRVVELAFWTAVLTLNTVMNALVVIADFRRIGDDTAAWKPAVWEGTSTVMIALLIPLVVWFSGWLRRRFDWKRSLLIHLLATVPFCLIHVGGMVGLRKLIYGLVGTSYGYDAWLPALGYEYLKDFRSYLLILAMIELYGLLLRRWQGEARMLSDDAPTPQPVTDRFLVKKLGREFLVKVTDIDWIESAGNYITLHVGDTDYLLRETMANVEQRLAPQGFARVHRSAIVQLDHIADIRIHDTGDGVARMRSGAQVPVSRRYRAELRQRLQ